MNGATLRISGTVMNDRGLEEVTCQKWQVTRRRQVPGIRKQAKQLVDEILRLVGKRS